MARRGMNRSLLLVVCDFLLLSILALARFDVPADATIAKDGQKIVSNAVIERISDGENYDDVVAELEATNETLLENLSSDKDDLLEQKLKLEDQIAQRQKELEDKENQIASRDAVIADNQEEIKKSQAEAQELERKREEIEKKREALLQTNAASKKELELLSKNLADAKKKSDQLAELKAKTEKEAETFRVELAKSIEKVKAEEKATAQAQAQLKDEKRRGDALVASTAKFDEKIDSINAGLKGVGEDLKVVGQGLAGVGDKITNVTNDVNSVKQDVSRVGQEIEGVGSKVENIKKEVEVSVAQQKENFKKLTDVQTKSLNEIFTRYDENKIKLKLTFTHKGGFMGATKKDTFEMDTIIMVDGSFAYSLVHARSSPFRLEPSVLKLTEVSGQINSPKLKNPLEVKEVAFMDDPRILIVPLYINPKELEKTSEIEVFNAPQNPYLFSEAVVVNAKSGRFGQTDFIRDERDSRYIKVSHSNFAFITGKFDPGKGDLVFSQKGELLGIMVNNDYAFHVKNLGSRIHNGSRTTLGSTFNPIKTNPLMASLSKALFGLNKKFR
jgi:archaellum component FlaC